MSKLTNTFETPIKDSGSRTSFDTGAVRDSGGGKGRMDLLPVDALFEVAKHFEKGAQKYEERNWEKGIPLSRYLCSALRHTFQTLRGDTDEPHPIAAAWNMLCYVQTLKWIEQGILPSSLNDLPVRVASKESPDPVEVDYDPSDAAALQAYEEAAGEVFGTYLDEDFADEADYIDPDPDDGSGPADIHDADPHDDLADACNRKTTRVVYPTLRPDEIERLLEALHLIDPTAESPLDVLHGLGTHIAELQRNRGGIKLPETVSADEALPSQLQYASSVPTRFFYSDAQALRIRGVAFIGSQGYFIRYDGSWEPHSHPLVAYEQGLNHDWTEVSSLRELPIRV